MHLMTARDWTGAQEHKALRLDRKASRPSCRARRDHTHRERGCQAVLGPTDATNERTTCEIVAK